MKKILRPILLALAVVFLPIAFQGDASGSPFAIRVAVQEACADGDACAGPEAPTKCPCCEMTDCPKTRCLVNL